LFRKDGTQGYGGGRGKNGASLIQEVDIGRKIKRERGHTAERKVVCEKGVKIEDRKLGKRAVVRGRKDTSETVLKRGRLNLSKKKG